ncbi:MAG TPA: glutamate--tRNA ligase [Bacteroidia bacterium]|nr:glutamate--tRNA ligase [Bacteroidia bacterium]
MNRRVRLRFAPSPTGPLHIGGVRTALYSYLFAKKHGGDFLLRIEDTDQTRFVPGAEEYIIDSLNWCGIKIDEGVSVGGKHAPYRQSERKELGIYKKYAEQLIASGHAYYAFDTAEELDLARKDAESNKLSFSYNTQNRGQLRNSLSLPSNEVEALLSSKNFVIRLKVEANEDIHLKDLIRGDVKFNSNIVDDKVLLKSDGMPTYHLAHIVDDYLMEITHAVRGEEWLPSAPAHVLIYQYLGWTDLMPQYAHLPLLLKPDGNGKLSKRDGDRLGFPVFPLEWKDPASGEISSGYRERGYEPDAFVNMLALLGWNPGTEQEIFSMNELIEKFSFEHVHKAGAKFNPEKTLWFNSQYVHHTANDILATKLKVQVMAALKINENDTRLQNEYLITAASLIKPRIHFTNELYQTAPYLFEAPEQYDTQVIEKRWKPELQQFYEQLAKDFNVITDFTSANADAQFKHTAANAGIKPGDVLQLFRVMLSGQGSGVDLFGMIALLGKHEVNARIQKALASFKK